MHVSTKVVPGLPSLRGGRLWKVVRRAFQRCCNGEGFRIVHFSVEGQHIQLICEARNRAALSAGVQGFKISVARRVNGACGRKGMVFRERYHERIITTPTQARHTIAYVLNNQRHHAYEEGASYPRGCVDPCSSARYFDGWIGGKPPMWGQADDDDGGGPLVAAPETWMAREGWLRGGGLISPDHIPALPRDAPALPVWD